MGANTGRGRVTTRERLRYNVAPLPDPPKIERRKSSVHGWGVFALQDIPKNKRIIDYAGERISAKASTPREERYLEQGHIWCFTLNRAWVIDAAVGGNVARFINHACKPNCYSHIIEGRDLDPRRAHHPRGRRADLRLPHRRRRGDRVPLPSGLQEQAVAP